ncbi:MAG: MFS transporter [Actinomycetota bacterium]
MRFVVLIGVVSLFADMAYEGARSVTGPFLALLGASAGVVGVIAGAGELLGYALRLVSGRLADRTGRYWPITLAGYAIQMTAVPLLAVAPNWGVAAVFIIAERAGKATRNPPRDVMLAHASIEIGRGWGFGVHEALDQFGALVGPVIAAGVLALKHDYRIAFALLAVPSALTIAGIVLARVMYPAPSELHAQPADLHTSGLPRAFWVYLAGAALVALGFADFALIAFHFHALAVVSAAWIPLFYSIAMGTGGLGSLVFGKMYDRAGIGVLVPLTIGSALFAPLVFFGGFPAALAGVALWGVGIGVHESIMAAAVAGMVPSSRLASAYGLFTGAYGVAWFLGSVALGFLYGLSRTAAVSFSIAAELAAIPFFLWLRADDARGSLH